MPGVAYNIADELAKKQKEISVSEFFERNKQLLGFDSPTRAIITSVKEAVDNSLDACEEAHILPDIDITLEEVNKNRGIYRLVVEDNGPGIVRKQISNVFGRLLYGSRFHAIRQSRGQQGIGISAVVMYAQLTTGRATLVRSKTGPNRAPHEIELKLDTKHNTPDVLRDEVVLWDEKEHGTRFECHLVARYQRGRQSAYEYLRSTAIVNPHAHIVFREPDGRVITFHRATDKLPRPALEIQPHPQGIMLGTLLKMGRATAEHKMVNFLQKEFSRISPRVAKEVSTKANIDVDMRPADLSGEQGERIVNAFQMVKIMAPPTDCLSPIGPILVRKGLKKETKADLIVTATRPASVYSGNPFQVEVGLVYGGDLTKDSSITILRFANRVPLLYQQGGCAITHATEKVNWRRYGLDQRGGRGIPHGPMLLMVHVASTQIPFTSESKEAIADDPEILAEVDRALREIGRQLQRHVKKKERLSKMKDKEDLVRQILPHIARKSAEILGRPVPPIEPIIAKIMNMVLLNGDVTYDAKAKRHRVSIEVTNYTRGAKTFSLYSLLNGGLELADFEPRPKVLNDDLLGWKISKMPVGQRLNLVFHLEGTEEDDFSANDLDLYVEGLDPELSNGVEAWDADAYDDMHREAKGERPEGYIEVDESAVEAKEAEHRDVGEEGEETGTVEETEEAEEAGEGEEARPLKKVEAAPDVEAVAEVKVVEDVEETGEAAEADKDSEGAGPEEPREPEDEPLLDELEEGTDGSWGDVEGEEGMPPWDMNGGRAEASSAKPAEPPFKVATIKVGGPAREDREDPEDPEDSKDPGTSSTDDDDQAVGPPRQSAIADFDDEFRMEMID